MKKNEKKVVLIDVFSDPVCPWCYIGKKNLDLAIKKYDLIKPLFRWHPFQLNPSMPLEGIGREEYLVNKFGSKNASDLLYKKIYEAGKKASIDFNFKAIKTMPNSIYAHILIETIDDFFLKNKTIEALFKSFFINGENIGNLNTLCKIAIDIGLDKDILLRNFKNKNLIKLINNKDSQIKKSGLEGVPFYIFEESKNISGSMSVESFINTLESL